MTVFRQENVDDYYDTGEELGRYEERRKRMLWVVQMHNIGGSKQMHSESGFSPPHPPRPSRRFANYNENSNPEKARDHK